MCNAEIPGSKEENPRTLDSASETDSRHQRSSVASPSFKKLNSTETCRAAMLVSGGQKVGFSAFTSIILTISCVFLTFHAFSVLHDYSSNSQVSIVWASAWMTCATTGLGALPFYVVDGVGHTSVGFSNAIAAGMMFTASLGLIIEGATAQTHAWCLDSSAKVLIGLWLGVGFIKATELFFADFDQTKELHALGNSMDIKRLLLIFAVMTLHSFAEGVGLGVSFHSDTLGSYITTTLAIHNVPEGLALGIVLIPRNISRTTTTLLCVFSSLPQPLMAVPAYIFVDYFQMIVPIGLGFAAGAMLYVAAFELFVEARDVLSTGPTMLVSFCASIAMMALQSCVH